MVVASLARSPVRILGALPTTPAVLERNLRLRRKSGASRTGPLLQRLVDAVDGVRTELEAVTRLPEIHDRLHRKGQVDGVALRLPAGLRQVEDEITSL